MDSEKQSTSPEDVTQGQSLARELEDETGRVICTCDGTANRVLACLKLVEETDILPGNDDKYEA